MEANFVLEFSQESNNGSADVFVSLEDDDSKYLFEVPRPQALASDIDERKQRFLEPLYPLYPFRIVREFTSAVLQEAMETFRIEEEDGFWFQLDGIRKRHKKAMQAEEEEDSWKLR